MSEDNGYLRPGLISDVRNAIATSMEKNGTDEKPGALESLPVLTTEDIFNTYKGLLSDEAVSALEEKVTTLVKIEDNDTISQVRHLGKRVSADKVPEAAKFICEKINELAAANLIKGALTSLMTYNLHAIEGQGPTVAVLSYLMLSAEGVEYFDKNLSEVKVEEGGMPSDLKG